MKTAKQRFSIVLESLGDDHRPAAVRLRQLLKIAFRGFRLRCTAIAEDQPEELHPAGSAVETAR